MCTRLLLSLQSHLQFHIDLIESTKVDGNSKVFFAIFGSIECTECDVAAMMSRFPSPSSLIVTD